MSRTLPRENLLRWGQFSRVLRAILRRALDLQHPPPTLLVKRGDGPSSLGLRFELAVDERECSLPLEDTDCPNAHKLV